MVAGEKEIPKGRSYGRLLDGDVAIVTGAGRGIGRAIATALARAGARVVLTARSQSELDSVGALILEGGGECLAFAADVTNEHAVAGMVNAALRSFRTIDILVNNAGIAGPTANVEDISLAQWEDTLRVNLTAPYLCSQAVLPEMKRKRSGRIINISSITGKRPLTQRTPYSASKMGLVGFTRSLALEVGTDEITVNAISPGATEGDRLRTIITSAAETQGKTYEEVEGTFVTVAALRRFVDTEDIAQMTVFLASRLARNITGQDITVSAGLWMD